MEGGKDLSSALSIAMSVALGLTSVAMLLRSYVRIGIQRTFTADDYILLFSHLCFIAFIGITFQYLKDSRGIDPTALRSKHVENLPEVFKLWWMGQQFSILAAYGVKIAIVVYFYSLKPSPRLQVATIITGVVTLVSGIATQVYELVLCWPISYYWMRAAPNSSFKGSCMAASKAIPIWQTLNTMCILLDIVLALLPCIMVWNLQMKPSSKIGVAILLGPGGLPTVAAILRSVYYANLSTHTSQVTYTQIPMRLTKIIEISIPIIVVCIARMRPLVRKIAAQTSSSRSKSEPDNLTIGRIRGRPYGPSHASELSYYGRLDSAPHTKLKPGAQQTIHDIHISNASKSLGEHEC